ncbi:hypothetical protein BJX76DRAFT_355800 [Aspergillus varians]
MLLPPESPVLHDSERMKEALCSGNIWVSQVPELSFNIRIASASDLYPSFARFVSQLGDSVCKAKMWSDLGLAVLYKSCIYEPEQTSPTYILSFGIQRRLGPSEKTKAPKVPKILRDACDAIPPTDIPTAHITSIDVRLKYNYNYKQCVTRCPQQESDDQSHDITQSTAFGDGNWEGIHCLQKSISTTSEINDPILEHQWEKSEKWEPVNYSSPESSNSLEFSALFQEALKALVLGDATRRGNYHLTGMDDFQSLSRIAASVFKPGYHEAMSQRSRLMLSIAKSLTSMLKLSKNQALKDRVASVKAIHHPDVDASNPLSNGDDTKGILKTKLWTIAQKKLYHAPIPKHLRPSNPFPDLEYDERYQDENLLLETITEGTAYFDSDCDDINYELNLYQDSNEPELTLDLHETGASNSSMILEDNPTEHSAEISGEHHHYAPKTNLLCASIKEAYYPTSPYTPTISLLDSGCTDADQGMLDFDFDFNLAGESTAPALSSQTSFPHSPHPYADPYIDLCEAENEDEMLCDDLRE